MGRSLRIDLAPLCVVAGHVPNSFRWRSFAIRKLLLLLTGLCAVHGASVPALAQQRIGGAVLVEKEVHGAVSGRSALLKVGDGVYANELITTAAASRANLKFQDRTDLQVGPASRVKLDSYVYSGDSGARSVVFNTTKGLFRFVSAPSGHGPYQVRTPTATIGVRGTTFGVRVGQGRTDAVLYSGAIEVCQASGANCTILDNPCTFVTVTEQGVTNPSKLGPKDWSFDNTCGSGGQTQQTDGSGGQSEPPADLGVDPLVVGGLGALAAGGGLAAAVAASNTKETTTTILPTFSP